MSISTDSAAWADWCKRHGVKRRSGARGPKQGVCPCKIGKATQTSCSCRHSLWNYCPGVGFVDHTETFHRNGRPAIVTAEPYDLPTNKRELAYWLAEMSAVAFQHPQSESPYFPGRTHLIAIVSASEADCYQALEPNAVRWEA